MKKSSKFLLSVGALGALASAPMAFGQSATTDPVGYNTLDVKAGNLFVPALRQAKDFQGEGTVGATGATSVITQTGAGWTDDQFDLHYIEILDGAFAGAVLDITANTAEGLTVDGDLSAFGHATNSAITYSIRRHNTLGNLFPNGGGFDAFADAITIFSPDGTAATYSYAGTNWVDALFANADNTVVYPNTGLVVNASSAKEIVLTGHVHWDNENSRIPQTIVPVFAGAVNIIATSHPVFNTDATPSTLSLSSFGLASSLTPFADSVTLYSGDGLLSIVQTYQSDGTVMRDGLFADASNAPIPIGVGLVVTAGSDALVTVPPITP